jgi:hypothetical protein
MAELRSQRGLMGSTADYRPARSGNGDSRPGHHKGDGGSAGLVLRARRNGLPVTRTYEYGRSSYAWAVRVLAAAEAVYGVPAPERQRRGRPRKDGTAPAPSPQARRCEKCDYLTTSIGHLIQCGGQS